MNSREGLILALGGLDMQTIFVSADLFCIIAGTSSCALHFPVLKAVLLTLSVERPVGLVFFLKFPIL